MNAREALRQHHTHVEIARLHGCVLARAALAVVIFRHDDRRKSGSLIGFRCGGDGLFRTVGEAYHAVALVVEGVHRSHEQVV